MPFLPNGSSRPCQGKKLPSFLFSICLFLCPGLFAQHLPDMQNDQVPLDSLRAIYLDRIGESSPLYNGVQYIRDGRIASGFPFFGSDSLQKGSVTLIGFTHPDIALYYDLVGDDLIAENFGQNGLFRIPKATVTRFRLGETRFIHLQSDSTKTTVIKDGYYEVVSAGTMELFIRWQKSLETRPGYENPAYKTYSYFFLRKGNEYFTLDGKKTLLRILNDQADAVNKFIRAEDLNFKKDPKSGYTKTLQYYAGLKN